MLGIIQPARLDTFFYRSMPELYTLWQSTNWINQHRRWESCGATRMV